MAVVGNSTLSPNSLDGEGLYLFRQLAELVINGRRLGRLN